MLQSVFRSRGFNTKGWGDKYAYKIDTDNPHSRCKMVGGRGGIKQGGYCTECVNRPCDQGRGARYTMMGGNSMHL